MDLNIATDAERQSAYFMSGGLVAVIQHLGRENQFGTL